MKELSSETPTQGTQPGQQAAPSAALLIDFDNVTLGIRSDLQQHLKRLLSSEVFKGKISVQRAYADWRRYPQYIVPLSESSIDLIFAPAFGANKKNATDIRLAIDALELVFTRPEIGTFVLLSGDGDFSSLVLKLKEYGKYVIGVGIRESSSDLLVQNCDEYYNYNELTGFAREGSEEPVRRDPWVLVVEAVVRMKDRGDVMRSDRLKQVMQEIDPHFTEKDAGFNRFGKFIVEAGKRSLLVLKKLDNGQYEIDIGPDANVPVESEIDSMPTIAAVSELPKKTAPRSEITLARAFELLTQSLKELGNGTCEAETVREKMVSLNDNKTDPVMQGSRFTRLLRQAHDAELIEVARNKETGYLVRPVGRTEGGSVQEQAVRAEARPTASRRKSPSKGPSGSKAAGRKGVGYRKGGAGRKPVVRDDAGRSDAGEQRGSVKPKSAGEQVAADGIPGSGKLARQKKQRSPRKASSSVPKSADSTRGAETKGSQAAPVKRRAKSSRSSQNSRSTEKRAVQKMEAERPTDDSKAEGPDSGSKMDEKGRDRKTKGFLKRVSDVVQKKLLRDPAAQYDPD